MPVERRYALKIAGHAGVDPRTAAKYLEGRNVSPLACDAIQRALRELGLPDPRAAKPEARKP